MNDRLAQVQPRLVYPVYTNKWEPELDSIYWTKSGAQDRVDHLNGPWCGDDDCFHDTMNDNHVFIGKPLVIQP